MKNRGIFGKNTLARRLTLPFLRNRAPVRLLCLLLSLCVLASVPASADGMVIPTEPADSVSAAALPSNLSADGAILMEAETGLVLYEKNADKRLQMASTTKIMTALLVLETQKLTKKVKFPAAAVGIEGSSAYFRKGEILTVEGLLYALMLQSANDAAIALAITVSGDVDTFVKRMNEKAKALGMINTCFQNPNGLPADGHFSTARDMAILTRAALQNESFRTIVSTVKKTVKTNDKNMTRVFVNHNRLLRTYDGMIGVKTGYTKKGGRCLVTAAEREDLTLICVTLSDPDDWREHTALLDYGFSACRRTVMLKQNALHLTLPIVGGKKNECRAVNDKAVSCLTMTNETGNITQIISLPRFVYAPVNKGDILGKIVYTRNGKTVGQSNLCAETDIPAAREKRGFAAWLDRLFHKE